MKKAETRVNLATAAVKRTNVEVNIGVDHRAAISARPDLDDPRYPMWIAVVTGAM